jgi:hypothetical protein
MEWYWWVIIGWGLSGLLALAMEFRDSPAMRENVGAAEVWPVILGPAWLMIKLWDLQSRRLGRPGRQRSTRW